MNQIENMPIPENLKLLLTDYEAYKYTYEGEFFHTCYKYNNSFHRTPLYFELQALHKKHSFDIDALVEWLDNWLCEHDSHITTYQVIDKIREMRAAK